MFLSFAAWHCLYDHQRALQHVPKVIFFNILSLLATVGKTREGHDEYLAMINHENTITWFNSFVFVCCPSETNLHQHCSRLTFSLPFAVSTLKMIRFTLQTNGTEGLDVVWNNCWNVYTLLLSWSFLHYKNRLKRVVSLKTPLFFFK